MSRELLALGPQVLLDIQKFIFSYSKIHKEIVRSRSKIVMDWWLKIFLRNLNISTISSRSMSDRSLEGRWLSKISSNRVQVNEQQQQRRRQQQQQKHINEFELNITWSVPPGPPERAHSTRWGHAPDQTCNILFSKSIHLWITFSFSVCNNESI